MVGRRKRPAATQDREADAATEAFLAEVEHVRRQRNAGNRFLRGRGTAYMKGATQALKRYRESQAAPPTDVSAIRDPRPTTSGT